MTDPGEQPKLLSYCTVLYERMDNEAIVIEGNRVWRGRLTTITNELGIPKGTQAKVVNALRELECIEQVSRGYRGPNKGEYRLLRPPTADLFEDRISPDRLTSGPTSDKLRADVEDIKRQLGGIDIPSALLNIEQRLQSLEKYQQQGENT